MPPPGLSLHLTLSLIEDGILFIDQALFNTGDDAYSLDEALGLAARP
ncbi:hypothetical protein [Demequina litorisediminis]|uniref:Uncharacterized protein n=1 Tax=Demequina litorisediminis TaxID=1849022 RepID=A0ABQ6IF60_9MICO|nr:hypothetical protein [Demequina litorisediminis]GMA35806.1 hypothetical protein GCM10025876_20100 [Demequina litorisediminis]